MIIISVLVNCLYKLSSRNVSQFKKRKKKLLQILFWLFSFTRNSYPTPTVEISRLVLFPFGLIIIK